MRIAPITAIAGLAIAVAGGVAGVRAAPDQTLGMAIMSASVGPTGILLDGTGVDDVSHTGTGSYFVTFLRDLVGCNYVASVGRTDTFINNSGVASAWRPFDMPTSVLVLTHDFAGSLADRPFQVIVFCPR